MVSLGRPVRADGIASKPSRPRERRMRRRAGGRVFSPWEQDGRWAKRPRAFSKLALGQGRIKVLTVRNLILGVLRRRKDDLASQEIRKGILATDATRMEHGIWEGPKMGLSGSFPPSVAG